MLFLIEFGDMGAKLFPDPSAVLTQLVATLVLILILAKFLFKPTREYLKKRKIYITTNIEEAEKLKASAIEENNKIQLDIKNAYKEAKNIISDANSQKEQLLTTARKDAQKEAQNKMKQAELMISLQKEKFKKEVEDEVIDLVLLATSQIISNEVTTTANKELIKEFINKVHDE